MPNHIQNGGYIQLDQVNKKLGVSVSQKEMDILAQMQEDRYTMSQLEEDNIALLDIEEDLNL